MRLPELYLRGMTCMIDEIMQHVIDCGTSLRELIEYVAAADAAAAAAVAAAAESQTAPEAAAESQAAPEGAAAAAAPKPQPMTSDAVKLRMARNTIKNLGGAIRVLEERALDLQAEAKQVLRDNDSGTMVDRLTRMQGSDNPVYSFLKEWVPPVGEARP